MNIEIITIALMYAALAGYSAYWMWFHPSESFFQRKPKNTGTNER